LFIDHFISLNPIKIPTLYAMASPQLQPDSSQTQATYQHNFNLIKTFLDSEAPSITQLSTDLTNPINDYSETGESSLWRAIAMLWLPLLDIVIQIPESHSWQDQLVSLVDEISKTPRPSLPESEVEKFERDYGRFWDGPPAFKFFVMEPWHKGRWERTPRNAAIMESPAWRLFAPRWTIDEWTSMNAFCARCNSRLAEVRFRVGPLKVLNHALEVRRRADVLDDNVPAAAVWMIYAGKWIFENEECSEEVLGVAMGDPEKARWLYEGPQGYNRERWLFWKRRFGEEAEDGEVSEKTRWFARKAHEEMGRVEGQDGDRVL
jgi:hypothetical protein